MVQQSIFQKVWKILLLQNCPKDCLKTAPKILQKLSLKLSTKINLPKLQKHNKLGVYDAHTNQQYSHK